MFIRKVNPNEWVLCDGKNVNKHLNVCDGLATWYIEGFYYCEVCKRRVIKLFTRKGE